jgi:hypothetical protein
MEETTTDQSGHDPEPGQTGPTGPTEEPPAGEQQTSQAAEEPQAPANIHFEETQDLPWPFAAIGLGAGAAGGAAAAVKGPFLLRFGLAGVAVGGVLLLLQEFLIPLRTRLLDDQIELRYGRRMRFRIPLKNVARAYARTYRPLREYGGWGIRYGFDGKAFNMRGNQGVQLVLQNGEKVLIGSQRPAELAEAIHRLTGCDSSDERTSEPAGVVWDCCGD